MACILALEVCGQSGHANLNSLRMQHTDSKAESGTTDSPEGDSLPNMGPSDAEQIRSSG